jgi:DNA-binding Lrp family transcriptional regulator
MNKNDSVKLTDLEEKILNELKKDCRVNLDEIGKKCGCSRYKVGRVMKKFEEDNIIVGYTIVLNPNKLKLKYFYLLVKRSSTPFGEEMLKMIPITRETDFVPNVKINNIDTLYVHGYYDWILSFTAPDILSAKEFYNKILKNFNHLVDELELLEVVSPFRMDGFIMASEEEIGKMVKIL